MTTYKMVRQCGDGPCGDLGQRLERKSRGHSRLEESCEGSQSPPKAVVLLMMISVASADLAKGAQYLPIILPLDRLPDQDAPLTPI
jgi:hypothetical protein